MAEPTLEQALRAAADDFGQQAAAHKRLERHHREAAQHAREAQKRLTETLAQFGIEVVIEHA